MNKKCHVYEFYNKHYRQLYAIVNTRVDEFYDYSCLEVTHGLSSKDDIAAFLSTPTAKRDIGACADFFTYKQAPCDVVFDGAWTYIDAKLQWISTFPHSAGKGLGANTLDGVVTHLRGTHPHAHTLYGLLNRPAKGFYQHYGARICGDGNALVVDDIQNRQIATCFHLDSAKSDMATEIANNIEVAK